MIRSAGSRVRTRLPRRAMLYRPALESLEPRLPPGDALLGLLLAWPELTLDISKPDHDIRFRINHTSEGTPAVSITIQPAVESAADEPTPTPHSPDSRAAGLIPAVRTAGINPAARRHTGVFRASEPASDIRAAGLIPAVRTAGINPAARSTVQGIGALASQVPGLPTAAPSPNADSPSDSQTSEVMNNYGNLPLTFEANHGQTDASVDFIARIGGATVFLTPTAAVFALQNPESRIQNPESEPEALATRAGPASVAYASGSKGIAGVAIHMQLVGANPNASPVSQQRQPGIVNYFIGNDPSQWHANIPTFGRVEYQNVYPGIDLAYYGNNGQLEYDFIVSPHADPSAITLNFAGADGVEINPQGDLVLHTAAGDVVQQKPLTYQEAGNTRQEVASRYVVDGSQVRFQVGAYDALWPLVIDPLVLGYSTYLGGALGDDGGDGIAVDGAGNAYVTGQAGSTKFPTTPGAFDTTSSGFDAFVAKPSGDGSTLAYATYLGGSDYEFGYGIAVDGAGNAYVTGRTYSTNFPTTPGAFDTTYNGSGDPFVAKLSASGSTLAYGTYLGGSGTSNVEYGYGIAVDGAGNAYVTGTTDSTDFPTTPGAFDTTSNSILDVFVAKLSASGSTLAYATYLGGAEAANDRGYGIAVDKAGNAYVTGETSSGDFPTTPGAFDTTNSGGDAFVAKLSADGSILAYGTFLGGSSTEAGIGIAVDGSDNAYVTGITQSTNFPTTPGAFDITYNGGGDGFVAKLSGDGSTLAYGTYLGGFSEDVGYEIAVDGAGNAYVTGWAYSTNFPTTPGAFDTTFNGSVDVFVAKLSATGSTLAYGTYLGGSADDYGFGIAVDSAGNAYVNGWTASSDFPTTPGALKRRNRGGTDAFVTKFAEV